jgi:hypothetical protein
MRTDDEDSRLVDMAIANALIIEQHNALLQLGPEYIKGTRELYDIEGATQCQESLAPAESSSAPDIE